MLKHLQNGGSQPDLFYNHELLKISMLQTLNNALTSFTHNIRIVDVLDIALIAFIFYFLLNWIRLNVARRSLFGFSILVIIYSVARFTGMYLTELFIEAFFFVFLIGLFIVFQSDIRRMIDRIGNWKIFNKKPTSTSYNITNVITEAAAQMAKNKTGALIVIRGGDGWERQIHGGIDLNGLVTQPLLISIFNPKAPGHDGAVLMEKDKILRFGVHLPLSTRLKKIGSGGTRHAAALGLSEQCDALVVVVSEERGVISVAQDGNIQTLENSSELKERLDRFMEKHYSTSSAPRSWWKRTNFKTAISAILLSFILWLGLVYQPGTVYRTFEVPVEYRDVPMGATLPKELNIRITVMGSEQAFENFNVESLVASINLSSKNAQDGVVEISSSNFNLPPDLKLYEITPEELNVDLK